MILNIIDFNDNLKKSYKDRYCLYRNLELGHEIHVYNENSLLLKKAMSQLNPQSKEYLSSLYFSYTYEYYKLFLMIHVGGWFIEEDMIIYDKYLNNEKNVLTICVQDGIEIINFCTWAPIHITHDKFIIYHLNNSLNLLKFLLKEKICSSLDNFNYYECKELSYQTVFIDKITEKNNSAIRLANLKDIFNIQNGFDIDFLHASNFNIEHNLLNGPDASSAKENFLKDHDNSYKAEKCYEYNDLLKFDTFKIMP